MRNAFGYFFTYTDSCQFTSHNKISLFVVGTFSHKSIILFAMMQLGDDLGYKASLTQDAVYLPKEYKTYKYNR